MRVSLPTIPHVVSPAQTNPISPAAAVERIASFLASGNVSLLTGAGVSVDSGIRAYRGKDGRYMNPNYRRVILIETIVAGPHTSQASLCTRPQLRASPDVTTGI